MAGFTLATIHNLHYYQQIMSGARDAILTGNFTSWKDEMLRQIRDEEIE